jgi:hypothetical protein
MANSLLTIDMITNEALMVLENSLTFTKQVNREYDDQFAKSGAKIGDTVNIRKPVRYVGRNGQGLSVENSVESSVPLTLSNQWGCDISFSTKDMTLSVDQFADRFLKPAIASVANAIDYAGMQLYRDVYNTVGTPGTTPSALSTYLDAGVKMDNEAAPRDGQRAVVLNPQGQATIVGNLTTIFNPNKTISDQYLEGTMGSAVGFKWSMDQNVATHTVGALGGTPLVNGTTVSGATTLVTDGWTAAAATRLRRGDVFTIAGVFAVNPQNRQSTGQLRQFVATADAASDASGNLTVSISPAIISSGQYQTVTALPADNAAITVLGAANTVTPQNMAFHRDAFTFATADLLLPGGVDMAARKRNSNLNVSMRMVRAYDINTDRLPARIDVLGGWATLRPELACRIAG